MSGSKDRPTTKALRLQAVAGLKRRVANRHQHSDPTGAWLNRREAEVMDEEAADLLTLPAAPEIGLGGEIVPGPATVEVPHKSLATRDYLRDVAQDKPDAAAAFASYARMKLAADAGAAEMAAEAADSINAANAYERMLAHQLAVAHKVGMEALARASHHNQRSDSFDYERSWQVHSVEAARAMNAASRLLDTYQRGLLTLHRLRQGGQQTVTVVHQHVQVTEGAQAVVAGAVSTGGQRGTAREGK
jgi:hypothetical protein